MSDSSALTPRQQRERDYYDQFVTQGHADITVNLDAISGRETRPWNPYWRLFDLVKQQYRPGARLLDFGCGWGENTAVFAHMGYQVEGFDISEANVATARQVAETQGLSDRVSLSVQTAENLEYPDASFDVIAGIDILHHVDIARAMAQCRRVLRPGGVAIFREPYLNPVFDTVRNSRLGRKLRPLDVSLDCHITEDERKLTKADLDTIRGIFPGCSVERFRILSRIDALAPRLPFSTEKVDYRLRGIPGYQWFCGTIILTARK
jgi:2-polyprenyl-3-methyl-5-hydroxy-6-metoxy-1,4-benzoquinol methylase